MAAYEREAIEGNAALAFLTDSAHLKGHIHPPIEIEYLTASRLTNGRYKTIHINFTSRSDEYPTIRDSRRRH
jgi:hypothetical protein